MKELSIEGAVYLIGRHETAEHVNEMWTIM
jgi:hypothetical protein